MEKQIKSKSRVSNFGEVYTAKKQVTDMVNLVDNMASEITATVLEPACGNGNFLSEILRRKLNVVKQKYKKSKSEYEKYSVLAVSSIYGVDLMDDNVRECRERLFDIWHKAYKSVCKDETMLDCEEAVKYILKHNILCGNALTMLRVDTEGNDTEEPIIFAQWDLMTGDLMKRLDYRLDELMRGHNDQMDMFMYMNGWKYDEETHAWIPAPIREFEPVNYWEVQNAINL